ncbi:MAG TPA: dipeptidase E [Lachnospiraceae bacterium]|nr:dipeptidase E [Lachnospiraceae bacterium]
MKVFMTSSPMGAYRSAEAPSFRGLDPSNGLVDELKRYWKEDTRCLLISAFPDEYSVNDHMREDFERIFRETGLSLECMDLCDRRNGKDTVSNLGSYDMVILGGGHVPTEKDFFDEIGLREAFLNGYGWDGIVMGISAGSMNCADVVYAQPEMPGEAVDPSYQKFIRGLGLTDVNVLPHYQAVKNDWIDGMRLMEDITYPDSVGRTFYAIVDGSFVLQTEDRKEVRGEAYRIADGKIRQVCEYGEVLKLA